VASEKPSTPFPHPSDEPAMRVACVGWTPKVRPDPPGGAPSTGEAGQPSTGLVPAARTHPVLTRLAFPKFRNLGREPMIPPAERGPR
jgi:hypothetical protein